MVYDKKHLRKIGIDEKLLATMLKKEVSDITVNPVRKGSMLHGDLYELDVSLRDGGTERLFVKDTYKSDSASGFIEKSKSLDDIEAEILDIGTRSKAFTPEYYGKHSFDDNGVHHTMIFIRRYDFSLEDKLKGWRKEYDSSTPDRQKEITATAINHLLYITDVATVNTYLLRNHFNVRDSSGGLRVRTYTSQQLMDRMREYLGGLIIAKILLLKEDKSLGKTGINGLRDFLSSSAEPHLINLILNTFNWAVDYGKEVDDSLMRYIAKPLASDQNTQKITHLDLLPGHILVNNAELKKYNKDTDPNNIIKLKEGQTGEDNPYKMFAVTDFQKVGFVPEPFQFAQLLSHPSVFYLVPKSNIREIMEHAMVQTKRIETGDSNITLSHITPVERSEYEETFNQACMFSLLRNMGVISWLHLMHKDNAADLVSRDDIYDLKKYDGLCLAKAKELDNPYDRFTPVIKLLDRLKLI